MNRLATDQGEAFSISSSTLYKRLDERRMVVSKDTKRRTTRWQMQGVERRVLHLRPSYVVESGRSGRSGRSPEEKPEKQAQNGSLSPTAVPDVGKKRSGTAVGSDPDDDGSDRFSDRSSERSGQSGREKTPENTGKNGPSDRSDRSDRFCSNRDGPGAPEFDEGDIR